MNLAANESVKNKRPQTVNPSSNKDSQNRIETESKPEESKPGQEKILITGDDVLIEYVNRLINSLKKLLVNEKNPEIERIVELFIGYYVWHSPDLIKSKPSASLWQRLEARLNEMRDRRKRLVKSVYKKEGRLGEFEKGYEKTTNQKLHVLSNFESAKLEEMLRTSQKNVAQQVVSILINCFPGKKHGILPEIEK